MKRNNLLFIPLLFSTISCTPQNNELARSVSDKIERHEVKFKEKNTEIKIGQRITGDFDGSGSPGFAYSKIIKQGTGNPVADPSTTADEYAVLFSNENIAMLPTGCCDLTLIYEGDLDGDGADEISVLRAPMNGCMHFWITYTYKNGKWKELFDGFFAWPIGCSTWMKNQDFLDMVVAEGGNIYYHEADINDENMIIHEDGRELVDFKRMYKVRAVLK